MSNNNINEEIKSLFHTGMTKAIEILKDLLKVKPVKNYKFSNDQINDIITSWNQEKIGDSVGGMVDVGIDLFIFVKLGNNLDMGEYNLAKAEILYISDTGQPLIGLITINKDIDYSKENSLEYFESIILHQFIHIIDFQNIPLKIFFQQR